MQATALSPACTAYLEACASAGYRPILDETRNQIFFEEISPDAATKGGPRNPKDPDLFEEVANALRARGQVYRFKPAKSLLGMVQIDPDSLPIELRAVA